MAGLMLRFRSEAVGRLRQFLLLCLGMFILAQALGHTGLSELSPGINSENLLVILLPLILMFATVFFFTCLDHYEAPVMLHPQYFRYSMVAGFVIVMCLPFRSTFTDRTNSVAYPPYYPPEIQLSGSWMRPDDLIMSDVPWAVAWYGHRQSVWLTLNPRDEFFALNDYVKPVRALYLTPDTLDKKFHAECVHVLPDTWGAFVLKALTGQDNSPFPLRQTPPPGSFNSGLFLTDRPRWNFAGQ
jgi:hypothetical protein